MCLLQDTCNQNFSYTLLVSQSHSYVPKESIKLSIARENKLITNTPLLSTMGMCADELKHLKLALCCVFFQIQKHSLMHVFFSHKSLDRLL